MLIRTKVSLAIALIVIVISIPYIYAGGIAGPDYQFGGFLLNPLDGNSYLAKMQQGLAGEWKFTLTYSPPEGDGAYIFLFYIFLGNLARITSLSLVLVFHLARIISAVSLLMVLWFFCKWVGKNDEEMSWRIFLLAAIGSGLGWAAAIFTGYISGDFWIAEAYPFLSMYSNPHFPLGLAIILGISLLVFNNSGRQRFFLLPILSIALATIQPFGIVVLALPLVGQLVIRRVGIKSSDLIAVITALVPGGIYLIYQYIAIINDPALSVWNEQNLTPAPPVWDLVVSLSPALILAVLGGYLHWKEKNERGLILGLWLVVGILLIYVPFQLQRRFMTGLYVPIAALAVCGIQFLGSTMRKKRWLWPVTILISILTNVLLLAGGMIAASSRDHLLFLSRDESNVLAWMSDHTPAHSVVLASPEMGAFIPAWSGSNVVYGHPYESVHAAEAEKQVGLFFSGQMDAAQVNQFVADNAIEYIFFGPRELAISNGEIPIDTVALFNSGDVTLYGFPP